MLTSAVFTLAAYLVWDLGEPYAPALCFYLICILLANCGMLYGGGNPAGLAVGLCVVGAWCFLRNRYVFAGVLAMAVSLTLKPHDVGLIWLYFILAGSISRKRALHTLVIATTITVLAIIWISQFSPD